MYFLKTRDDAMEKVRQIFEDIRKPGKLVCVVAGEFNLNAIEQLCIKQIVRLELSAPYTPEDNGEVERNWGTKTPMARCLIEQLGLDRTYSTYAIHMSTDVKTFCYNSGIKRTPFEEMFRQKPVLGSKKIFLYCLYSY